MVVVFWYLSIQNPNRSHIPCSLRPLPSLPLSRRSLRFKVALPIAANLRFKAAIPIAAHIKQLDSEVGTILAVAGGSNASVICTNS
ncbi:hypothetical protein L1987_48627 [Smallanthus sonchifolius]|uniref:Uncharacterized protein n=1 Tax=Smallanthus sonchifolius TaxID=185202 RepID=A0ACB9FRU4_9ASTR|nr:hypothetical protein L1987_48627 [Smallanthus sonchifolius]